MAENIQSLFTEEEWKILRENTADLYEKVKNLPLHIEEDAERMGKTNE